jgi:hypothetical protein
LREFSCARLVFNIADEWMLHARMPACPERARGVDARGGGVS